MRIEDKQLIDTEHFMLAFISAIAIGIGYSNDHHNRITLVIPFFQFEIKW